VIIIGSTGPSAADRSGTEVDDDAVAVVDEAGSGGDSERGGVSLPRTVLDDRAAVEAFARCRGDDGMSQAPAPCARVGEHAAGRHLLPHAQQATRTPSSRLPNAGRPVVSLSSRCAGGVCSCRRASNGRSAAVSERTAVLCIARRLRAVA